MRGQFWILTCPIRAMLPSPKIIEYNGATWESFPTVTKPSFTLRELTWCHWMNTTITNPADEAVLLVAEIAPDILTAHHLPSQCSPLSSNSQHYTSLRGFSHQTDYQICMWLVRELSSFGYLKINNNNKEALTCFSILLFRRVDLELWIKKHYISLLFYYKNNHEFKIFPFSVVSPFFKKGQLPMPLPMMRDSKSVMPWIFAVSIIWENIQFTYLDFHRYNHSHLLNPHPSHTTYNWMPSNHLYNRKRKEKEVIN